MKMMSNFRLFCVLLLAASLRTEAQVTEIATDFDGYWFSRTAAPNTTVINNSHNLLAFTYNGTTYSTGVNNTLLTSKGLTFTPGNFRALPVAGIAGNNSGSGSTYLTLAKKVDGSATIANITGIQGYSIRTVLTDGINGLDLGTGVTNLPTSAILTFSIFNINAAKVADAEPDIIITQVAQPVTGNDVFGFIDASGNLVGNTVSQDMTQLAKFGSYDLDLFNLTPNTPWNNATAYSVATPNTNRDIRLVAFKLSDFGITAANVGQVKALKVTPSGNSDYAFIAYNTLAINIPPNISQNMMASNTTICSGGTASLSVIGTAASGGTLSYSWQMSADGGNAWSNVTDGGPYSGATTATLKVTAPANGEKYRAIVYESGNPNTSTSATFTITVNSPTSPSAVSISGGGTVCLNDPVSLSSSITGGSNLFYQWQSNASGSYTDIAAANFSTYTPPVGNTGSIAYRLKVTSGSGCAGEVISSPQTIIVTGISTVSPAAICSPGAVTLNAAATSGNVSWYSADAGGTALYTGNTFTTPVLSASTTYYVASSGCASALRVPVTATINQAVGGTVSGSTTVLNGINSTTLTLTGHTGNVVNWQSSTDNFGININNISNTTTTLNVTDLNITSQFRAVVQNAGCASAISAPATITVQSASTLPVHFVSIKAFERNDGIVVQWIVEEKDVARYEVEKSANGKDFKTVYSVLSLGNARSTYQWTDAAPVQETNYYRIHSTDKDGKHSYSTIVKFAGTGGQQTAQLFPNPVREENFTLQLHSEAGNYTVRIINNMGNCVSQINIAHLGASGSYRIPAASLPAGIYLIEIAGTQKKKTILRLSIAR